MPDIKTLEGTVMNISFQNEETGFTVAELETEDEIITIVGEMGEAAVGLYITAEGEYVNNPSFGVQFKVNDYTVNLPGDENALKIYLSSGSVKGVGPALAKRMVDAFGEDILDVIENDADKLCTIKGISRKMAFEIQQEFRRINGIQDVMANLKIYGITGVQAVSLYKVFGQNTIDEIKNNPYILCDAPCYMEYDFVDNNIAYKLSVEYDSRVRVVGGLMYVLRHNYGNGHSCLPMDKLTETVAARIGVEPEKVSRAMEDCFDEDILFREEINGREFVYLPDYYVAEMITAGKIAQILSTPVNTIKDIDSRIQAIQVMLDINYAPNQIEALKKVADNNLCIITGGPGTGKTTLVKGIIAMFEAQADIVSLCAPTGRAAKRLAELSDRPAKTIHRLLEVMPGSVNRLSRDNKVSFSRNANNPLECDVLIVDECSMVDIQLFCRLMVAVKDNCRVVLVGDYNQLPAVGPGNVLKDLLETPFIPSVMLTDIFRQARQSNIIVSAHGINRGKVPVFSKKTGDCFFIPSGPDTPRLVSDLVSRRLPKAYGYDDFDDIQVICPSRKTESGTANINTLLQQVLNPPAQGKKQLNFNGLTFREGDKVMQIKNNYDIEYASDSCESDKGVFNGDIGRIIHVDSFNRTLTVKIDDKTYVYTSDDFNQLEHAWAVTVHKSQGSEFNAVVLCLNETPKNLQYRNLLYTAFTRAKQLLVVVGDYDILTNMIANTRKQLRFSGLKHFLEDNFE